MTAESRQQRIKELFNDALELDPAVRDAFLDANAADDVREDVLLMLRAHERAGVFLADPAITSAERPGDVIGRYRLQSLLGEGGFGSVYHAEQLEPVKRTVALKIIKLGMDTRQVMSRFDAERQAIAMMDHPNIATVYDAAATATGRPYFVMEYVDGQTLTEYCDRQSLSIDQRLDLFLDVCGAVQHAHTKGVIHRDLKPSNILVSRDTITGKPCPKVIDFGIAKSIGARLTDASMLTDVRHLVGTPEYMSPEQADLNAEDIDTRSDVYSLGVILYELLTGKPPFDRERLRSSTFAQMQRIIREEEPARPSTVVEARNGTANGNGHAPLVRSAALLRGDLDWITLKALEKDRDQRYGSTAELADDLRRHLSDEPVRAVAPSRVYRLRKFVRRHRVGVTASVVIALALCACAAGITVGLLRARASAAAATVAATQAQAVNDFMRMVLTSVGPERNGADVRLVDVMDDASSAAAQRFADHPLLEAEVRDLLGSVYAELSMWNKAKVEYQRAMTLWQTHAGPDDPRALTSERLYVGSAINNQQTIEVGRRLPNLLERTARVFGPDALPTLDVRRTIGLAAMFSGRHDEAERIFLDIRASLNAHDDNDDLHMRVLRNLVRIARSKAIAATGDARSRILEEAEALARERVERALRTLGPEAPTTLDAQVGVAQVLVDQQRFHAAAEICNEVLALVEGRFAACHHIAIGAKESLSTCLHRLGDSEAAAAFALDLVECAQQSESSLNVIVAIGDALPILDRGGRWAEGETLAKEYADRLALAGGGHGDMAFLAELWIARFTSLQGRWQEAEAMFASLAEQADAARLQGSSLARLRLFHGSNLRRLGLFEDAEAELLAAAQALPDDRQGTNRLSPDDVTLELITLYREWNKPDAAAAYAAEWERPASSE